MTLSKNTFAPIRVVGIDNLGISVIDRMLPAKISDAELIVIDTDISSLSVTECTNQIPIFIKGRSLTLEAHRKNVELATQESRRDIVDALAGAQVTILAAGLGGSSDSVTAVVAEIVKELGILTVGVFTKNYPFEGRKRAELAEQAIERLLPITDCLIVIQNPEYYDSNSEKTTLNVLFESTEISIYSHVQSLVEQISSAGSDSIELSKIQQIVYDMGCTTYSLGGRDTI